jgi:hypothetical protein
MGMVKQMQMEQADDELNRTFVECHSCGKKTPMFDAMYCGETDQYVCDHCGEFELTSVVVLEKK